MLSGPLLGKAIEKPDEEDARPASRVEEPLVEESPEALQRKVEDNLG